MALFLKDFDKDLQCKLRIMALKRRITLAKLVENLLQKEVECDDDNEQNTN